MKSNVNQIIRLGYTFVLMTLVLSCSDSDFNDVSYATDCEDDIYGENQSCNNVYYSPNTTDMSPPIDMELDFDPNCNYLATSHTDTLSNRCLDLLTQMMLLSEAPQAWCEQDAQLTQALDLSQTDKCHDRDGDCWYQCDGWNLPSIWQDPDDRRALVGGSELEREQSSEMLREDDEEAVGMTPPPSMTLDPTLSLCVHQALDPNLTIESQPTCLHQLFNGFSKLFACEEDAIAVVSEIDGQPKLSLQRIQNNKLEEDYIVNLDFTPQSILCKLDDRQSWTVLLFGETPQQVYEFTNQTIAALSYGMTAQRLLDTLSLEALELEKTYINQQGLQTWSYTLNNLDSSLNLERSFTFKRLDQGTVFGEEDPDDILTQQFLLRSGSTVRELNLRSAYLNSDHSVSLKDEDNDLTYDLFSQYAPFQDLKSSEAFLALIPRNLSGNMLIEPQKIFFSLWNDADELTQESIESSLLGFPLVFDAQLWGFEGVTLHKLTSTKALLKLRTKLNISNDEEPDPLDPNTDKYVWGVYDILTDRLQTFEALQLTQALNVPLEANSSLSDPNLHNSWISWSLQFNEYSYLMTYVLD